MDESASEAGRLLVQHRWNTPEQQEKRIRELASRIAGLTAEEFEKLKGLVNLR